MEIYVVQPGDSIFSIANKYKVSATQLIQDNGLNNPFDLVPGQTIIILTPKQTYTVQEGDSLARISAAYGIPIMQLLRNNPFLYNRVSVFPGETLVISYNTSGRIETNGYAYPYLNSEALKKTLPFLTYLSVFNYRISEKGEILSFGDDSEIIKTAKDYGVMPFMMISVLSPLGEPDIETIYEILISEEYQERLIENSLSIIKSSGYYGLNVLLTVINTANQKLYLDFLRRASTRFNEEGYQLFITMNPNIKVVDSELNYEEIDYAGISQYINRIIFLQYVWGVNTGPPSPVSSVNLLKVFIDHLITTVPAEKITTGIPVIGYDWELPYIPNRTIAYSLTIDAAITLAHDMGAEIIFDDSSQTPFFQYNRSYGGLPLQHIVWFVDARSINSLDNLISDYGLSGSGIWNIMIYNQQMWSIINSRFDIIKMIPDNISNQFQ